MFADGGSGGGGGGGGGGRRGGTATGGVEPPPVWDGLLRDDPEGLLLCRPGETPFDTLQRVITQLVANGAADLHKLERSNESVGVGAHGDSDFGTLLLPEVDSRTTAPTARATKQFGHAMTYGRTAKPPVVKTVNLRNRGVQCVSVMPLALYPSLLASFQVKLRLPPSSASGKGKVRVVSLDEFVRRGKPCALHPGREIRVELSARVPNVPKRPKGGGGNNDGGDGGGGTGAGGRPGQNSVLAQQWVVFHVTKSPRSSSSQTWVPPRFQSGGAGAHRHQRQLPTSAPFDESELTAVGSRSCDSSIVVGFRAVALWLRSRAQYKTLSKQSKAFVPCHLRNVFATPPKRVFGLPASVDPPPVPYELQDLRHVFGVHDPRLKRSFLALTAVGMEARLAELRCSLISAYRQATTKIVNVSAVLSHMSASILQNPVDYQPMSEMHFQLAGACFQLWNTLLDLVCTTHLLRLSCCCSLLLVLSLDPSLFSR